MSQNHSFSLITLGCKVNQYESQAIREAWSGQGDTEAKESFQAQTVCINTCAVTAKAVADARATVRRVHRENPEARIVVTGCAAQVLAEEFSKLPGVALVVPQKEKARLLQPIKRILTSSYDPEQDQEGNPEGYTPFSVTDYDRSRAVLKVQDGCSHRCTYCIIPLTRGPSRSREPQESLAEMRRLLAAGFRELVINGVNLSQYGRDLPHRHDFWDLISLLEKEFAPEWQGRARLRLSSLEPGQLNDKALETLNNSRMIAPHIHLSLQSGSSNVLKRMGRGHYKAERLPEFFRQLGTIFPRFGLGADLLSSFPGETEDDAAITEQLVSELPFSYAHVFPYSRRPGTPAAAWKEQLDPQTRKERAARLRRIVSAKKQAFLESCLELEAMHIAWEGDQGHQGGVNEYYAECRFANSSRELQIKQKSLVAVKATGLGEGFLWVEPRG